MPPPNDRRPGFSRKAQLGIFTGYVAAILGALAGVVLIVLAILDNGSFAFLRRGAAEAMAPVGAAGTVARTGSRSFFQRIGDYFDAADKNAALRREVQIARVQQIRMRALAAENRRLKTLLGVVDRASPPVATTRLVASTSASTRRFAVIGAGANQGVAVRMPVRTALGLVGRVLEVGPNTARVLLVTDGENVVPLRRARDGIAAFSEGLADGRLRLRLIDVGVNPLKRGDVFVTSGSGGIYQPGIPVAQVESLTPDGAIARILSDPAASEFVIVDRVFQELPDPAATPAPAGSAAP
ncbi:MAG: rod shape-determining protein MreC [Novosphingobium sp.]|nr:rod shape-determining protein MreC [Novosphingobium sp.]